MSRLHAQALHRLLVTTTHRPEVSHHPYADHAVDHIALLSIPISWPAAPTRVPNLRDVPLHLDDDWYVRTSRQWYFKCVYTPTGFVKWVVFRAPGYTG